MTPEKYKTKNGNKWKYRIYLGKDLSGKKIVKTHRGFRTKSDALIAYAQELEKYNNGTFTAEFNDHSDMTITQLYNEWLPKYKKTVEPSTFSKTEYYFKKHILPDLGNYKIQKLTASLIQDTANQWSMEAKSGWKWAQTLKRLLNYADLNGYLDRNPFYLVKKPKQINTTREQKFENVLHSEQIDRFLEYWADQPLNQYAYFRLLLYSGIRRGEANALEWSDIDFKAHTLSITKSIGQGAQTGDEMYLKEVKSKSGNRTISLDQKTITILKAYQIESKTNSGPIWPGKNKWMDFHVPTRWLAKMRKDSNVDDDLKHVTIHGLRHSHATMIFEQASKQNKQAPIKAVQKRLGHADIELTLQIYTHVSEQESKMVDDILSDM